MIHQGNDKCVAQAAPIIIICHDEQAAHFIFDLEEELMKRTLIGRPVAEGQVKSLDDILSGHMAEAGGDVLLPFVCWPKKSIPHPKNID